MKLERWRGWNVLLTDAVGLPVLRLDQAGNVVESGGAVVSQYAIAPTTVDTDGLARSVADWIVWTMEEPGEVRSGDIHPQLRDRVIELQPDAIEP